MAYSSSKIVRNLVKLGYERAFRLVLLFISISLVAKYLGPEKFGILNYLTSFAMLFMFFGKLGLDNFLIKEFVGLERSKKDLIHSSFILRICSSVVGYVVLIVSFLIFADVEYRSYTVLLAVYGSVLFFQPFDIVEIWHKSRLNLTYIVLIRNISVLISTALKVAFVYFNKDLIYFISATLVEHVVAAIGFYILNPKFFDLKGKVNWKIIGYLGSNGIILGLISLTTTIFMRIDILMVGNMLGSREVGIYTAATRLSDVLYIVPTLLSQVLYPNLIHYLKNNDNKAQFIYDIHFLVPLFICLMFMFISDLLITFVFGVEFAESSLVFKLHLWSMIFVSMGLVKSKVLLQQNRVRDLLIITVLSAVMNVVLNFYFIPTWGIQGAAYSTLICYSFVGFGSSLLFKSHWEILRKHLLSLSSIFRIGKLIKIIGK
ncbi:flippase [Marinoscillum sp.]|uniref:flippase n=1 Tax=Marinoscillum sp. TaxID=2024838 RepID=UPI003BAD0C56